MPEKGPLTSFPFRNERDSQGREGKRSLLPIIKGVVIDYVIIGSGPSECPSKELSLKRQKHGNGCGKRARNHGVSAKQFFSLSTQLHSGFNKTDQRIMCVFKIIKRNKIKITI